MLRVRIHGRGGRGAVTAAEVLSVAAFLEGHHAQAVPSFGSERNCFECDNCYGVCPDNAVIKLGAGDRYEINLDYCKGCGICVAECPCGAIEMRPERT